MSLEDRPTILLVGEGERMADAIAGAMERHRLLVERTDLTSVVDAAFAAAPDLLLLMGHAAADGGQAVLERLSAHAATTLVPVVLLTEEDHARSLPAFRRGVVATVPRTASADEMARRVAELARELPDRPGEVEGELGEASVDALVALVGQLRSGILNVTGPGSEEPAQLVLQAGKPAQEALAELVERLRPLVGPGDAPLRYEFHESTVGLLDVLGDGAEEDVAFRDRRILLIEENPARADALVQELRARGAVVVVADGRGRGLDRARALDPEVVVLDGSGVEGWALRALRMLRRDARLRWGSLLVVDSSELWPPDAGEPDVSRLAAAVVPLVEPDRALAARAADEAVFDTRLELTGPTRMLRALLSTGRGLQVSIVHPKHRVVVDLAEGLVAGASATSVDGREEGPAALSTLLALRSGRVRVERRAAPSSANLLSPLDDALAAAEAERPLPVSSDPPPALGARASTRGRRPEEVLSRLETILHRYSSIVPEPPNAAPPGAPPPPIGGRAGAAPASRAVVKPPAAALPPKRPRPPRRGKGTMLGMAPPPPVAPGPPAETPRAVPMPMPPPEEPPASPRGTATRRRPWEVDAPPPPAATAPPAQDLPAQDLPAQDLPAQDLPAQDLPAQDLPIEVVPAVAASDGSEVSDEALTTPYGGPALAALEADLRRPATTDPKPAPVVPPPPAAVTASEAPGDAVETAAPSEAPWPTAPARRPPLALLLGGAGLLGLLLIACLGGAAMLLWPRDSGAEIAMADGPTAATAESDEPTAPVLAAEPTGEPAAAETEPPSAEPTEAPPTETEEAGAEPPEPPEEAAEPPEEAVEEAAAEVPEEAAEPDPEDDGRTTRADVPRLLTEANYLRRHRHFTRAERMYITVLHLSPNNGRALAGLARLHMARRDPRNAVFFAQRLVRVRPRAASNHVLLGDTHRLAGDTAAAREAWERALEIDPRHRGARRRLGR
jgi:DNA-binding response OmpR family regulator